MKDYSEFIQEKADIVNSNQLVENSNIPSHWVIFKHHDLIVAKSNAILARDEYAYKKFQQNLSFEANVIVTKEEGFLRFINYNLKKIVNTLLSYLENNQHKKEYDEIKNVFFNKYSILLFNNDYISNENLMFDLKMLYIVDTYPFIFKKEHIDHIQERFSIWSNGCYLLCDVVDKFFCYKQIR